MFGREIIGKRVVIFEPESEYGPAYPGDEFILTGLNLGEEVEPQVVRSVSELMPTYDHVDYEVTGDVTKRELGKFIRQRERRGRIESHLLDAGVTATLVRHELAPPKVYYG